MTTMMGPLGVLAGVLAMLVGALHLLMYVYFRDVIEEDYRKSTYTPSSFLPLYLPLLMPVSLGAAVEGRHQNYHDVDQVEVAMEPDPNVLGDFYSTSTKGSTYSTTYGSVGDSKATTTTYGATAPVYEVLPVGK